MRDARVIKIGKKWECRFVGKKGEVKKMPVTDRGLCEWLDQNIEDPSIESPVKIPHNTQLKELVYGNKHYPDSKAEEKRQEAMKKKTKKGPNQNNKEKKFARAPYNFVPLNAAVAFQSQACFFDKFFDNRYTGYLELEVTNLTPLFIRQVSGKSDSYRYGENNYGIPGSSMRGMIRTICEIISFGRFGKINDTKLYYREMFGNSSLAQEYKNELDIKYDRSQRVSTANALKAGWLKVEDGAEYIYPASTRDPGYNRYPVNPYYEFTFERRGDSFKFTTGFMPGKKYGYEFIIPQYLTKIPVDPDFTKAYKNDISRSEKVDKFYKNIKKSHPDLGVPVFYKESGGVVVHYGHTMNYRLPYTKSVSAHIPKQVRPVHKITDADLVLGLFGDVFDDSQLASRLAFGDLIAESANVYDAPQLLKILSSPKPTTYQHYLEQGENALRATENWNSDANIRGFKMYWHRKTKDDGTVDISWNEPWEESMDNETISGTKNRYKTKSHSERVKPIKPGAIFKGKIWFQNLTKTELGLLLMALEPNFPISRNAKIAHKIGMAKPLGLGSITVTITDLKVFNMSKEGYLSSFDPPTSKAYLDIDKEELKNEFDIECALKLGLDGGSIWDTDRLKELKAMMIWNEEDVGSDAWLKKTRYMEIERGKDEKRGIKGKNEFKDRPILPRPSVVKKEDERKFV